MSGCGVSPRSGGPYRRRPVAAQRGTWPIPGDTPTDRARTLARGLLVELEKTSPATAAEFVERARQFGETWLGGDVPLDGPWLTAAQVAEAAGVKTATVSKWVERGLLTRYPEGFADREVVAFLATTRPAGRRRACTSDPRRPEE